MIPADGAQFLATAHVAEGSVLNSGTQCNSRCQFCGLEHCRPLATIHQPLSRSILAGRQVRTECALERCGLASRPRIGECEYPWFSGTSNAEAGPPLPHNFAAIFKALYAVSRVRTTSGSDDLTSEGIAGAQRRMRVAAPGSPDPEWSCAAQSLIGGPCAARR
jgi:hypothetical protein